MYGCTPLGWTLPQSVDAAASPVQIARMTLKRALAGLLVLLVLAAFDATAAPAQLRWDDAAGLVLQAGQDTFYWGTTATNSLQVRFPGVGAAQLLRQPSANTRQGQGFLLAYQAETPEGVPFRVERRVREQTERDGIALVETLSLSFARPVTNDVEIELPFAAQINAGRKGSAQTHAFGGSLLCPLKNGWAKSYPLTPHSTRVEYRLGNFLTGNETPNLALPLVLLPGEAGAAAIFADPMFSALFSLRSRTGQVEGSVCFRYAASKVPLAGPETRTFVLWLPKERSAARQLPAALDAWFRWVLPDVPPGPKWLHEIAMVDFDFLSDGGQGWERDVGLLASWLKPSEHHRVALCLHGWYDALGSYCYDVQAHRMKEQWIAFERTRKVAFTQAELKRRLRLAHDLGFRVLLYFADGVAADSGVPGYRDDWAYRDAKGNKISGWQGPDTFGTTYMRNLGLPEVVSWHTNYLAALLQTYGADTDGFVWDETFHGSLGMISLAPNPAYCDRTMMALVKALTHQVHAFDPQKVFLASDCIGAYGWNSVPGYGMMADGTYQDSHCDCAAWSYGLFPNWRNTLWSCNWFDISDFQRTRWGVRRFGAPVAISNGWGDDCGPSEWTPRQREAFLRLFHERLRMKNPVRFLAEAPASVLSDAPDHQVPGDAIPQPAPGEFNWALAGNGGRATASSQDVGSNACWPASGAIDGCRDDAGWGAGHGWASQAGVPLPQWLEVNFEQERTVQRFVVITYQKEKGPETAGKWGLQDYSIEVWDKKKQRWHTVATQTSEFPGKVRVHQLPKAVRTDRCRIVVTAVAPLDGQARLLQLEAWGR
jgi:F5/8 type C domain